MMKFPQKRKMSDRHVRLLEDIFEVVRAEAARHHFLARMADQKHYHDQLWENICVYIIGSKYGIAVLEDEVAAELNPNVALKYGFMKALDHPVALLQWSRFQHVRADLSGKLARTFDIKKGVLHKASLRTAVSDWLREQNAGDGGSGAAPVGAPEPLWAFYRPPRRLGIPFGQQRHRSFESAPPVVLNVDGDEVGEEQ